MNKPSGTITILDPEERFILKNFELQRDERPEIEGLRAAFRHAARRAPFTDKMGSMIRELAVAKMRLDYLQAHEKFFFDQKAQYSRTPMVIAALMGDDGGERTRADNEYVYSSLRRAFSPGMPETVNQLAIAANILAEVGTSPFCENSREEIFCAHIQALENAEIVKNNFDRFPPDFHEKQLSLTYPSWESFLDRGTYIGQHLQRKIDNLVRRTQAKFPPAEVVAFPAPKG